MALAHEALRQAGVDLASVRLIGGAMVTLHVRRLGLTHVDIRATADADIALPYQVVAEGSVVDRLSEVFDTREGGNRWTSPQPDGSLLALDVLVHHPRAGKAPVMIGGRQFDRAPGLWVALQRTHVPVQIVASDFEVVVSLPDVIGALSLKLGALSVRTESKDAEDVLRLLECADAEAIDPAEVRDPIATPSGRSWSQSAESLVAPLRRIAEGHCDREALGPARAARLVSLARRFTVEPLPAV